MALAATAIVALLVGMLGPATPASAAGGLPAAQAATPAAAGIPAVSATSASRYEYYRISGKYGGDFLYVEYRGRRVSVGHPSGGYACMSGKKTAAGTWKGFSVSGDGFTAGSITSAVTFRRTSGGTTLTWSDGFGTIRAKRSTTAAAARAARAFGLESSPRGVARWCRGVRAKARVKAVSSDSRLRITVYPPSQAFDWKVKIQRKRAAGWSTYRRITVPTQINTGDSDPLFGVWSRRTVDLPRGTYRVVVQGVKGFPGSRSAEVKLAR